MNEAPSAWCAAIRNADVSLLTTQISRDPALAPVVIEACVRDGSAALFRQLLDLGYGWPSHHTASGKSIVHYAASERRADILDVLSRHGFSMLDKGLWGHNALHEACGPANRGSRQHADFPATVDFLLQQGVPIDAATDAGKNVLALAGAGRDPHVLAYLMTKATPAMKADTSMKSAAYAAASDWRLDTLRALHDGGADLAAPSNDASIQNDTLMHVWAASALGMLSSNPQFLQTFRDGVAFLKSSGIPVDAPNDHGHTPLMSSLIMADVPRLQILVEAGASITARDKDGLDIFGHLQLLKESDPGNHAYVQPMEVFLRSVQARQSLEGFINALRTPRHAGP